MGSMKIIIALSIFVLCLTNIVLSDTQDTIDTTQIIIESECKDQHLTTGLLGFSLGSVFGAGFTLRLYHKDIGFQGSFGIFPEFFSDDYANNYAFGLACSKNILESKNANLYIIAGTSLVLQHNDNKNLTIGLGPAVDLVLPPLQIISLNFGFSISYFLINEGFTENETRFKILPEIGLYIRLY